MRDTPQQIRYPVGCDLRQIVLYTMLCHQRSSDRQCRCYKRDSYIDAYASDFDYAQRMEGTCLELALEGERLCKAGDCRRGVQFFEAAVQVGTDDLQTLGAIYSQLGNAYFYLQEYGKALEYHKHDLNLTRAIGDRLGEAKASGNLGNTLKVLGKYEEAVVCCQRHLDISRELNDRIGEARALYNLGNVYHTRGKHMGHNTNQDPGQFPPEVKESLQKAVQYYEKNLEIVCELGDRAAQGRACGNLGNTYYLLANFKEAIKCHEERLAIAKEFGDKSAERRAYSNLGNTYIFLGQFDTAAEHYRKTLQIARQLADRALEAQACYSLGNTYTLLQDFERAIKYHMLHLQIAQELGDKIGEGRACWSLGNAHTALSHHEQALEYAARHLTISKEIGDETGKLTAQMNLAELKEHLGIASDMTAERPGSSNNQNGDVNLEVDAGIRRPPRMRRSSMERMEIMRLTPDKREKNGARPKPPKVQKAATVATDLVEHMTNKKKSADVKRPSTAQNASSTVCTCVSVSSEADQAAEDSFFDLLSQFQGRRIDDQRCSVRILGKQEDKSSTSASDNQNADKENTRPQNGTTSIQASEFLDLVAGIQGSRMNDQRADLPEFPGLHNQEEVIGQYMTSRREENDLDDQFFEMLMRCQGSRIDDQRTSMPEVLTAPTVPDEDFFSLIQRVQSDRLDEQRSKMPKKKSESEAGSSQRLAASSSLTSNLLKKGSKKDKKRDK
ncbi:hypothetical protein LSH36_851g00062 [Paralvinella palmiformis]|uniref:G-protein-signaling modulator 2 n=1 Tax=Paralvinella palmiformis TaxID=53620 RepID=A0AAD9MTB0_9ANNE|nr:hypothetical protein LSH36_851g00062 [Paralvinella palmiformis]